VEIDPDNPPAGLFVFRSHVAFDQLDMQGVLHHSRHLLHVERAAQAFFELVTGACGFDPLRYPDLNAVVRRLSIDYLSPLFGVRPILVTLRVARLRSCAMDTAFELRSADGGTLFSRGLREVCRVSPGSLRPTLWSDAYMESFAQWQCAAVLLDSSLRRIGGPALPA
jgi:acyl-CoA thioester hydrolase